MFVVLRSWVLSRPQRQVLGPGELRETGITAAAPLTDDEVHYLERCISVLNNGQTGGKMEFIWPEFVCRELLVWVTVRRGEETLPKILRL